MRRNKGGKISPSAIVFMYPDGQSKTFSVNELLFDEQQVIQGSILFFCDPEPCMIHRGAVISRYIGEILQWIQSVDSQEEHPISGFQKDLLEKIDDSVVRGAHSFRIILGDDR